MAKTAAEIIAFHFGSDIRDVQETRYQPTRYRMAIYVIGPDYYCCPPAGKAPQYALEFGWLPFAEHYGRKIFCAQGGVSGPEVQQ